MTAEQSKELLLSVQGLKKNFGEREILKGIDFDAVSYTHLTLPTKLEV